MKKNVCFMLSVLLLVGLTACGNNADSAEVITQEKTEVASVESTEDVTEVAEATTEEVTETVADSEDVADEATEATQSTVSITVEDAQALVEKTLGTADEETGNTYSFMHVNTMTVDGVEYHVFTWSWLVNGTVSHLTDLFVTTDGSAIYEGMFAGDNATVYTEDNYLE